MRRHLCLLTALTVLVALVVAPAAGARAATSITDAPTRTVKAGPGKVGYRAIGRGSPVVLVMGLSGTMDGWPPSFVDGLAAAGHRVVVFDNEGIGRSTKGRGALTIKRMADTTAALIRALHLRRADVLGWSMGGMIAQATALEHPRVVRRLVLCATAPGDGHATAPAPEALKALSGKGDVAALLGLLFPAGQDAALNAYIAGITSYRNAKPAAPPAVTTAQTAASAGWMIGRDPASASPARIRQPMLVAGGEEDRLLPVANERAIAARAPHATLKTYAGAAHGFLFQDQADFLPRVARFLARG